MIANKRKMSLAAAYLTSLYYVIRPGTRAASGLGGFFFEFVGQRSHIVLSYCGASR
jgi:hypothetical protein